MISHGALLVSREHQHHYQHQQHHQHAGSSIASPPWSSFFTHTHTQAITCIDTAQVGGLVAAGDASGTITIYRLRPFLSRTKAELLEQVYTTNLAGFGYQHADRVLRLAK
jgi:hypothetical protein